MNSAKDKMLVFTERAAVELMVKGISCELERARSKQNQAREEGSRRRCCYYS